MRIAVAAHSARRVGGVEQYLAAVVPALVQAGHDVACWFETDDVDHTSILARGGLVPSWTASREPERGVPALRAWRPDVVYAHGVADASLERALLDVAPSVLFAHSYYGTCISGTKTVHTPDTRGCTRTFGASCLLQYYPRRCGGWSPVTMLTRYSLQQARLSLLGAYDAIAVASRHMAEEYARHVPACKVHVVRLPIESTRPVPARRVRATGWRLLYLGRLEASKGADTALEAAARAAGALLEPVHLQVSGAGTLHESLAARAVELMRAQPMLQITFTGWLDQHLVAAAIDQSDLLLVPSRWPEPFGMVGVEAALRGVPSIAFAVGGIPEWLADGVNGRLVAEGPRAAERFGDAVAACLRDEPALARMREHGRSGAARFGMASHLDALQPVLAAAARRCARPRAGRRAGVNMRVLFAIHGPADERTAVYRSVRHRVEALRARGHHADLLSAGDLRGRGPARLDPLLLAPALSRRRLTRYDAVVFHSHLGWAFHAARPWLDPGRRVRTITSFHGLEPLYFAALDRELSRRGEALSARFRALHGQVVPRLLRYSCQQSDAVFCLNTHEVQYLTAHGWAAPERVYRLANGVEGDCFMDRSPSARARRVLFVGQWLPAKGTRDLVEAFSALAARADLELVCVGTGAGDARVLSDFPDVVRGRVRVRPSVDRSALHAELAQADLFVFPSLSEGFSNALLEAMAASLPIVATPVGAAVDLLRDGVNAAVVPAADPAALMARIESLLANPGARAALGRAAQATAREYQMEHVNERFVQQLLHVVEWRPSAGPATWRHVES